MASIKNENLYKDYLGALYNLNLQRIRATLNILNTLYDLFINRCDKSSKSQ